MRRVKSIKTSSPRKPSSKLGSARRARSFIRQLLLFLSSAVLIIALAVAAWFYHFSAPGKFLHAWVASKQTSLWSLTGHMGLTLENIYLEGETHTPKEKVIAALNARMGQPILAIPLWEIQERLEKIDWVKYAVVERKLPHELRISIVERKPLAIWQKSGKLYLVDDEGHMIQGYDPKAFSHLLIMIGDDVPSYVRPLLTMIKQEPELYSHIAAAIRVGERRWNIRFNEGIEIKLPEENADDAWRYVVKLFHQKKLLGANITAIDLRVAEKVYIKTAPEKKESKGIGNKE